MVDSALTFLGNIFAGRSKTYKMILLLNKSNMTLAFMLLVLLVTARWYLKQHCVILYHKYKTYQNNKIKFWHIKKPSITDYLIWCTRDKSQKHVISLHWGNRLHAWEEWETEWQQAYVPEDTSFLFLKFNTSNEQVISCGSYCHKGFKRTDCQ